MKFRVCFIERRDPETSSLEKVFRSVGATLEKLGIAIEFKKMPFGNDAMGMLKNILSFRRPNADIYHITGHIHYLSLVMPVRNTVLTVHDLTILGVRRGIRRYLIRKFLFEMPIARLKYITAISQNTKDELVSLTGCDPDKVLVIENPLTLEPIPHLTPFRRTRPVILQVGTAPHKNLEGLVEALKGIDCVLRVIGSISDSHRRYISDRGIIMENLVDLSNEEMSAQYVDADIMVFCSKMEGFGLPIVEAQACGLPVITSNISPMKDVAGAGAILADPDDPGSIRDAVLRIMSDAAIRERLMNYGYQNIPRFSPEKIAGEYLELYQGMLEVGGSR